MPMTVIFIAAIAAWLLYRNTTLTSPKQGGRAFALLIIFVAILAAAEWYLYLSGDIYHDGIAWEAMARPLLFIAFISSLSAWRNTKLNSGVGRASRIAVTAILAVMTAASFLI